MKRVIKASTSKLTQEQWNKGEELRNALARVNNILDDPLFDPGNKYDILQNDSTFFEAVQDELQYLGSLLYPVS